MRVVEADTLMGLFLQSEHGKMKSCGCISCWLFVWGMFYMFFSGDKLSFLYGHQSIIIVR